MRAEDEGKRRGPWLVTGSREIHRTPWMVVREDAIVGAQQQQRNWTVVQFRPAVGILALTADRRVHLVGQHRYAVDRYEWELPAGGVEQHEDLLEAAQRELREETGVTARRWTSLGATQPLNGSCDAIYHLFLSEELDEGEASPDEDETLEHRLIPLDDLLEMVQGNAILDALTVVGAYRAWHHLRGRESAGQVGG